MKKSGSGHPASFITVLSAIKLQKMPSAKKRPWRKRSNRMSLMSRTSIESAKTLVDIEDEFLHAAEFGDVPTVKQLVDRNADLNVDCIDALGRTALRLAVKNEHLEVVEILLDRSSELHIQESVLQAISANHVQIAETILKHRRYLDLWNDKRKLGGVDQFFSNSTLEESQFSPDITPLILASQKNQYEIVQLLLLRGEIIQKPHKFNCTCQDCVNKIQFDKLRLAKYRLNAYRGLASEAYISLSSKDPILTAFELADELQNLSTIEKYFKNEYLDLVNALSEYVVKLLDRVRTQEELEVVLNKTGRPKDNKYESLARFNLAIQYSQKKFVSHPSCQQRLVTTWYTGMENMQRSSWARRIMMAVLFFLSYPFLVLAHLVTPGRECVKYLRFPCVKFICQTTSFLIFLVLIIVSTAESSRTVSNKITLSTEFPEIHNIYTEIRTFSNGTMYGNDFPLRPLAPTMTQILISLWVIGFACQECAQLFNDGISEYMKSWYNLMDITLLCVYFSAFTLRYAVMFKMYGSIDFLRQTHQAPWTQQEIDTLNYRLYWLNEDRFYWMAWDPINMSEGLFAMANILSFSRISYLLPANEVLGPLQISLGKMITDILKFLALFMLVLGAFMVGLFNLFWYYSVHEEIEVTDHGFTFSAEKHFGDVMATFRTVFWSVFGRGDTDVVTLGEYDNHLTEDIGYIIYGMYNIAMVIVLLNMLIAMMSRSFENITRDSDSEWKFARSTLYMDYIGTGSALPVPLNVLAVPRDFIEYIIESCCRKSEDDESDSDDDDDDDEKNRNPDQNGGMGNGSPIEATAIDISETNLRPEDMDRRKSLGSTTGQDGRKKKDYQRVMQTIIQRYIFEKQREAEVTEDDFEEIKQDISSFRYEILNNLELRDSAHGDLAHQVSKIGEQVKMIAKELRRSRATDDVISECEAEDEPEGEKKTFSSLANSVRTTL
ncbi:short transient receptor potential channel 3-like isoform X2 [Mizuhopecten yessoensis]|uniref:short transient receptor potential channel 3-like isoform X2 n=1 Tax=Mizuhopecten yessoensis TaxID=6573 RepID=UPI000B45D886|nr:short transient receptor potential channel 3-like isoform X2 [Mizuhopecten yessoensis]